MNQIPKCLLQGCALMIAVLLTPSCFAEQGEEPRQYEVELIVFQNLIKNDGGEVWPIDYSGWFEEARDEQQNAVNTETRITWLPESSYRLAAERHALGRSAQYRPIAYLAWRQPVLDRERAKPVTLPVATNSKGKTYVDGSVRVAVERYLHLYLDLQLHTQVATHEPGLAEFETPEFRLREHRRMRSKEVHYFDNPRFGVIALITPYETEKPEPEVPDVPVDSGMHRNEGAVSEDVPVDSGHAPE